MSSVFQKDRKKRPPAGRHEDTEGDGDEDFEVGTATYEKVVYSKWPALYDVRMKSRQLRRKDENKAGSLANLTNVKKLDVKNLSYDEVGLFLTYWVGRCEGDFRKKCLRQEVDVGSLTCSIGLLKGLINTPREAAFYTVLFAKTKVVPSHFSNLTGRLVVQLGDELRKEEFVDAMELQNRIDKVCKTSSAKRFKPYLRKIDSLKIKLKKTADALDVEKRIEAALPERIADILSNPKITRIGNNIKTNNTADCNYSDNDVKAEIIDIDDDSSSNNDIKSEDNSVDVVCSISESSKRRGSQTSSSSRIRPDVACDSESSCESDCSDLSSSDSEDDLSNGMSKTDKMNRYVRRQDKTRYDDDNFTWKSALEKYPTNKEARRQMDREEYLDFKKEKNQYLTREAPRIFFCCINEGCEGVNRIAYVRTDDYDILMTYMRCNKCPVRLLVPAELHLPILRANVDKRCWRLETDAVEYLRKLYHTKTRKTDGNKHLSHLKKFELQSRLLEQIKSKVKSLGDIERINNTRI